MSRLNYFVSMALHHTHLLFHMTSVVARKPFLTVSDKVRLKPGCVATALGIGRDLERFYILYFRIRMIIKRNTKDQSVPKGKLL